MCVAAIWLHANIELHTTVRACVFLQSHVWWDQKLGDGSHGVPIFALDPVNGHIALHQDGEKTAVTIMCTYTSEIIDRLIICNEAAGHNDSGHTLIHHMSFSSDGLRLVLGMQTQFFMLCVFSRSSPKGAFSNICSHKTPIVSSPHPPTFCPGRSDSLCWIGSNLGLLNAVHKSGTIR